MDLKQLEYFIAVVEKGSFSKAAIFLNLAQPSISRKVALLEEELGQRLLERTGRGVKTTDAGQTLLAHAKLMLDTAATAAFQIKEMSTAVSGKVVVGLPHRVAEGLCVPLVQEFRKRMPHAMISVVEGLSVSLREGLINGRIDLAVLFDPPPTPLLSYEKMMRERLILIAPDQYQLKNQVSLAELAHFPMILPGQPNPIRNLVDAVLLPQNISLNVIAEVGAVYTALKLVENGVGCSILPESALKHKHNPNIKYAQIGPPAMRNLLVLATPKSRPINRLHQETAKLLRELDFRA
ncbi:LysR family transcriptional regulator [Zwartia panacis]|uniref:LysR family transcriptional regulator n=1 Tax=Zwartia panacis TaxID=2683345 RepID=UPI0025B34ADD|nr:LysR substrate-binding domain-containing protein [Zwartia panacis]MDN4017844.1 LysR substrate-binding domain-containing protein [Zwartia panacis]